MPFVAEGSECAARIDRVLCGRINRAFGAHPYRLPQQPGRRAAPRKIGSTSGGSGCLSCFWVGFPPAPRYQLPTPTALTALTTFYHFCPHLTRKSFIVKQKLQGCSPTWALIQQTTRPCA